MGFVEIKRPGEDWNPLMHATIKCNICHKPDNLINMVITDVALCEQCAINE